MMMVVALLFVFSCLLSWIPGGLSAEVVVTRVGDVARLNCNCSTANEDSLIWKVLNPFGFIYANSFLKEPYKTGGRHNVSWDSQTGASDLVITNVNEDDARKYVYEDADGKRYFELVVLLVDNPTCRANISDVLVDNDCDIDPDYIEFNCSIVYRGNVAPDMQLQMSNIGVLDNVTVRNWTQSTTKYTSVVWASKASWQMKGGQFRCQVRNTIVGIQPTCSTTNVSIIYFYKSNGTLNISSNLAETTFNCSAANTSEHCSFTWQGTYKNSLEASDLLDVSGPTIDLKSRDVEFSSLRCHAECRIRNELCVSEPMFIEFLPDNGGDSSSKTSTTRTILWLILGLIIVIFLIRTFFACRRFRWYNTLLEFLWTSKRLYLTRKAPISERYDRVDLQKCDHSYILPGFMKVMEHKRLELEDCVDPENGLLIQLRNRSIIDELQRSTLHGVSYVSYQNCNKQLLDIIASNINSNSNPIDLKHFIEALCDNKQDHIARFIVTAGCETASVERLLPRELREAINDNMFCLKKLINTEKKKNDKTLLDMLFEEECITQKHRETVIGSGPELKAAELLKIIRRRRYKDYYEFIHCLRETRQKNIVKILEKGGVGQCEVELVERNNRKTIKAELMKRLECLVGADNESELSGHQRVMIKKFKKKLAKYDIDFIGACPGTPNTGSISVFLQVTKGDPSSVLTNGCNNGSLKITMENMFQALLNITNSSPPLVEDVKFSNNNNYYSKAMRKYFKSDTFAWEPNSRYKPTSSVSFSDRDHAGYLTGVTLYSWKYNGTKEAIGGIRVTYSDGASVLHGSDKDYYRTYNIDLNPQEKIMSANVRCCVMLDALTFKTNAKREFGPFGGKGGAKYYVGNLPGNAFLDHLEGTVDEINGRKVVRNLKLVWEYD